MSDTFIDYFLIIVMSFFAFGFLITLIRAFVGPRFTDRLVGVNMTSSLAIAFICILSVYLEETYIIDISIVYTMLSFLTIIVLSKVVILHHKGRLLHLHESSNEEDIENA